jgi:hypothetical protein
MADTIPTGATPTSRRGLFAAEPVFAAAGLLIALSLAVTLAAMTIDPRLFQGEAIWIKPIKFQVALTIYLLSLAFFARWLPAGLTATRTYRIYAGFVVFACVAELAWVGGAAMAGIGSHFNIASPLMARLYSLMGILAVALTSASLVYGVAIWRSREPDARPALRLSIALGLVLTFVLTVPIAGTMASMPGHFVGQPVAGAVVPLMGWSREVGDLRLPHFFATHAMHFLPLAGLAAERWLDAANVRRAVWAAAAVFTLFVLVAFAAALAGRPLLAVFR